MDNLGLKKLRHMEAMLYVQKFGQPPVGVLKMASSQGNWWLLEQEIHWALLDEKAIDWTDFVSKLQCSQSQHAGLEEKKLRRIIFDGDNAEFKELNQRMRTYQPPDLTLEWD